jgi:hypothetical protein
VIPPDRDWERAPGASADALKALRLAAPSHLPRAFFDFLAWSDGGQGPLAVQPLWFMLYPASETLGIWQRGEYAEHFPGLFVFGSNGAGEAIAFDLACDAPRVVYFDMTNVDLEESVVEIAPSMTDFLALIGLEDEA